MTEALLQSILEKIQNVNIAIYGDFCLDAYWLLDPHGGEISVETGLKTEAVRKQYYTLGGASNVVANLAALSPKSITLVGVTGDDLFGREMRRQFYELAVDCTYLTTQTKNYDTIVFSKRILNEREQPRIDFGFFNERSRETENRIIHNMRKVLDSCDAMIFNQQVPGCLSDYFIEQANVVFDEFSHKIILLDTRHYGERFHNIYRKTNEIEAALLVGDKDESDQIEIGRRLYSQFDKPVFITQGENGILAFDEHGASTIPGLQLKAQLDTVGAGDTVMSALALSLAAGFYPADAANFANLAAGVTVQKLFQTGTATGEEILELYEHQH
jgi:rfaE bifunctional protein kinase chain/domain